MRKLDARAVAITGLTVGLLVTCGGPKNGARYATWSDYGGSSDSMQYSALDQINKTNVRQLKRAWTFLAPGAITGFAFNPLVIDDVMYVVGRNKAIAALEAATGKQLWGRTVAGDPIYRGFNYWESEDRSDRRLILSADSYLQELDARTGTPITSFGTGGRVNLRDGLPRAATWSRQVQSETPGRVFENLILLGSSMGEEYDGPPGDLRAFDVLTGRLVWTFHTIPHPGEAGYETWPPDAWNRVGGANCWGEISIDEKRGIAYFPLGSATYDFYGANRKGSNLFANCLLALDARTGKRLWHFQAVHHDLWDYDLTAAPKLMTVQHDGKSVDIVAQATKSGFLFVFNRETGEPLWPIEERPVPQSDVPGEESWPTQPFPLKPPPFVKQTFTEDDINTYVDAAERARLRTVLQGLRNEGIFTPPSLGGSIVVPGHHGGANFGAGAADPRTGMMYVRTINRPGSNRLTTTLPANFGLPSLTETRYYGQYANSIRATNNQLAVAAPWSEIVAYDLNQGTIRWRIPLSTIPGLAASHVQSGIEHAWRNGPVATAGGLLFVASANDRKVHAYDSENGDLLWEADIESNPDGIPAIYEVGGKQYVVFFASSIQRATPASIWTTSPAEAQGYYAFALP
jgi:quinoprotein glucose dehydrogenase